MKGFESLGIYNNYRYSLIILLLLIETPLGFDFASPKIYVLQLKSKITHYLFTASLKVMMAMEDFC